MKKLALINSYCNTEEKITVLKKNLVRLKELGLDTLLYSPIPLPNDIIELADHVIFNKYNPVLYWPTRGMISWKQVTDSTNDLRYKLIFINPDYGWASLYQYKKLMEYGSTLDYDYYFWFIYDVCINDTVTEILTNPQEKTFFKSQKSPNLKVGGIFASFSKDNIKRLYPLIDEKAYVRVCKSNITEYFVEVMCNLIDGHTSEHIITDEIDEYDTIHNKADLSHPFELFFSTHNKLYIAFWSIKEPVNLTFNINDNQSTFNITTNQVYESEINCSDIIKFGYQFKDTYIDLSSHFEDTVKNVYLIEKL